MRTNSQTCLTLVSHLSHTCLAFVSHLSQTHLKLVQASRDDASRSADIVEPQDWRGTQQAQTRETRITREVTRDTCEPNVRPTGDPCTHVWRVPVYTCVACTRVHMWGVYPCSHVGRVLRSLTLLTISGLTRSYEQEHHA